jgi:hypothetical protein
MILDIRGLFSSLSKLNHWQVNCKIINVCGQKDPEYEARQVPANYKIILLFIMIFKPSGEKYIIYIPSV